jgi:Asp-tRNA(Asn)/Glu-tRNA(Gln) amidotransferase C subunit
VEKAKDIREPDGGDAGNPPRLKGIESLEEELVIAADLAYLNLGEDERRAFALSVGRMLEFFAKMDEFASLAPADADASGGPSGPTVRGHFRADTQDPFAGPDPIGQAPHKEGRFVGIPNIL